MVENRAEGTSRNTSFRNTKANNQGGLMSVIQSGLNILDETVIYFIDCPNMIGNEADEGGLFYINQPYITVHLINVDITSSIGHKRAGVVFIASGVGFIIENSRLKDVTSARSMILYSTSTNLRLHIQDSTITCDSMLS